MRAFNAIVVLKNLGSRAQRLVGPFHNWPGEALCRRASGERHEVARADAELRSGAWSQSDDEGGHGEERGLFTCLTSTTAPQPNDAALPDNRGNPGEPRLLGHVVTRVRTYEQLGGALTRGPTAAN